MFFCLTIVILFVNGASLVWGEIQVKLGQPFTVWQYKPITQTTAKVKETQFLVIFEQVLFEGEEVFGKIMTPPAGKKYVKVIFSFRNLGPRRGAGAPNIGAELKTNKGYIYNEGPYFGKIKSWANPGEEGNGNLIFVIPVDQNPVEVIGIIDGEYPFDKDYGTKYCLKLTDLPSKPKPEKLNNAHLISALSELREKIWFKVDSDIDITARSFADAKEIQKDLWWSDIFGTALNIVTGTINSISSLLSVKKDLSQGLSEEFLKLKLPLEIFSGLLTVESMVQSGKNLQLAIDGPAYSSNVEKMLDEAYKKSSTRLFFNKEAFKLTVKGYLKGSFSYTPIIVARKSDDLNRRTIEVIQGADQVKFAILHRFSNLIKKLSDNPISPSLEKEIIIRIEKFKNSILQSTLHNEEIKYETYLRDGTNYNLVEQKLSLGSIGELEKIRINALGDFNKQLEREEVITLSSAVGASLNVIVIYVTLKAPSSEAGGTLREVSKTFILPKGINLSQKVMHTSVYKTNPREQVNMIPQEMLLSLSKELCDLWMLADDIANYIEYQIKIQKTSGGLQ